MITIGSSSTLSLSIPSNSERNWGTSIRTGCFQKIADHNHQGLSGTGAKLTGYLALDLTTSIVTNDTWLLARNAANSANLKILKMGSDNLSISIGDTATPSATTTRVGNLIMKNNTFITAVNAANSAAINLAKVNASNKVEVGDSSSANVSRVYGSSLITSGLIELNSSTTTIALTDAQAATDTGMTTALSGTDAVIVDYKIVRNSLCQRGTLYIDYQSGSLSDEFIGTNNGVTFSLGSGLIKAALTSTGQNATLTYTLRRA